jgi:CheY-like chemotaxis protein
MAHFLIADDEAHVRSAFRLLLESQAHTYEEAGDILSIVKAVRHSELQGGESFDLILMDYDFKGPTGLDAIQQISKMMGTDYCEHRIVVITGSGQRGLSSEFAKLGAIGHLLKPVNELQFWSTIDAALTRRDLYIDKKLDWESAFDLLSNLGILEGIESLKAVSEQYEALKTIHQNLLNDLQVAGQREQQIATAYTKATEALNNSIGSFESIYSFLQEFGYTRHFLDDVERIFCTDRLHFIVLQSYLQRIKLNPKAYMIKALAARGKGHYEYRVGRSFRLYFRYSETGGIVLERFGHKTLQEKIISFLEQYADEDISQQVKFFVS